MAIKRCPYCRSIIDEVDRFCINCGTQLLFPEDEKIEEDIPGERIIEVEEPPPAVESKPTPPPLEDRPATDFLRPPKPSSRIPDPLDKLFLPEEEVVKPAKKKERAEEPATFREFATRDLPEMGIDAAPPARPEPPRRPEDAPGRSKKTAEDFDAGFPASPEEMDEISKLMSSLEKPSPPKATSPPPPLKEDIPLEDRDLAAVRFEEGKPPVTPADLPPWAERVKDGVTPGIRAQTGEEIPRELGDLSLEVEEPAGPDFSGDELQRDLGRLELETPMREEIRARPRRRRRGFFARLKARIYDILFVTLLWAAALWISSRLLGVSIFTLVSTAGLETGIFYLILAVGYFALFLFFLGETLGDRLSHPAS